MKSTGYMCLRHWVLCITLVSFLFSCDDAPDMTEPTPPSGYSLVSIDYTLTHVSPLREPSHTRVWDNGLPNEIVSENTINCQASFRSVFSEPNENPDFLELLAAVEVYLPRLDETGTIVGLSNTTFPLAFGKVQAKQADAEYSLTVTIPAYSVYTVSPYDIGWNVTTRYVCTVENDDTKERSVFSGTWRGDVYYRQEIYLSEGQDNIIEEYTHPISY